MTHRYDRNATALATLRILDGMFFVLFGEYKVFGTDSGDSTSRLAMRLSGTKDGYRSVFCSRGIVLWRGQQSLGDRHYFRIPLEARVS
jgi:hypothetical protein